MDEISQYFKRKDRKTSSESSESISNFPEDKITKLSATSNLPKEVVSIRKKQIDTLKKAKKEGKIVFFSRAEPYKLFIDGHSTPLSE